MRHRLVRSLLTICLGVSLLPAADAQIKREKKYRDPDYAEPPGWSVGMNIGMSDLWGDVGTKSLLDHYANDQYWNSPKFMGGIYARYRAAPALAIRLGVNHGTLYANDDFNYTKAKKADNIEEDAVQRYYRNLNVKSIVWEGQLLLEINPYRFNVSSTSKLSGKVFQPYLVLGVGGFHYKPKVLYRNRSTGVERWVNAHDYKLEGQGFISNQVTGEKYPLAAEKYSLWQMNVPLGLGLRWEIGKKLALGVEYMYRYCMTDYLDDVSGFYIDPAQFNTNLNAEDALVARDLYDKSWIINPDAKHGQGEMRGNPAVKDGYSTFGINLYYKIKSRKSPWWY